MSHRATQSRGHNGDVCPSGVVGRAAAFTLTELLIVIAIITIVAFLAVPVFRTLTGGRSTEAAYNQLNSLMGRARGEAIGLQTIHGVAFFIDTDSQRVQAVMVRETQRPSITPAPAPDVYLDFIPDRDPVLLPTGVGLQMTDDCALSAGAATPTYTDDVRGDDAYIGFNTATDINSADVTYGGVILFDGYGRLVMKSYAFKTFLELPGGGRSLTTFGKTFEMDDPPAAGALDLIPAYTAGVLNRSGIGFVVFDEESFLSQWANGSGKPSDMYKDPQISGGSYTAAGAETNVVERDEEKWIDANAVPLLVNRNNGTVLKGE